MKRLSKILKYVICSVVIFGSSFAKDKEISISAAASLEPVIKKIIAEYSKENKVEIIGNYGGSGTLRKQIENGAEVDVVFFADKENYDILKKKNLVSNEKLNINISNTLVFVGDKGIKSLSEIKNEKIAIGDPKTVPVGRYAMEYINAEGYAEKLKDNIVYGKEVRAVTNYFDLGEVEYAIIYKTELAKLKKKFVVSEIDPTKYTNIEYSSGILLGKDSNEVKKFYSFFNSEIAKKIFEDAGYKIEIVK
ncbi:MAG: molybdate ABC transporter substrate-binding protein [Fusobacteriaceae bacterium]